MKTELRYKSLQLTMDNFINLKEIYPMQNIKNVTDVAECFFKYLVKDLEENQETVEPPQNEIKSPYLPKSAYLDKEDNEALNDLLKKAGIRKISDEKVKELTFYTFADHVKLKNVKEGLIHFNMYDYQKDLVDLFQHKKNVIINTARQNGITTILAVYVLWYCMFNEDKTVEILSNNYKNATYIIELIKEIYDNLASEFRNSTITKITQDVIACTKDTITFNNKTIITARGMGTMYGDNIIGVYANKPKQTAANLDNKIGKAPIDFLIIDNCACIPHAMSNKLWKVLQPCLTEESQCIIASTPSDTTGLFYDLWHGLGENANKFVKIEIPWVKNKNKCIEWGYDTLSRQKLSEFIVSIGGLKRFELDYECKFVSRTDLKTKQERYALYHTVVTTKKEEFPYENRILTYINDDNKLCIEYKKSELIEGYRHIFISADASNISSNVKTVVLAEFAKYRKILEASNEYSNNDCELINDLTNNFIKNFGIGGELDRIDKVNIISIMENINSKDINVVRDTLEKLNNAEIHKNEDIIGFQCINNDKKIDEDFGKIEKELKKLKEDFEEKIELSKMMMKL